MNNLNCNQFFINKNELAELINDIPINDILIRYFGVIPRNGYSGKYSIPCPIHRGKHKNFSVDTNRNMATCYSKCARSYNVISLLYEAFGKNFDDVVLKVSNDFNIDLSEFIRTKKKEELASGDIIDIIYNEYVSEQIEAIKERINNNKVVLIDAPTGGGKTNCIIKIMKSYENNLNILLTPNVIQNKQNAKEYNVQAFTGSDTNIYSNCISATYDKARAIIEYLKAKDIKYNLFVDEVHLLVDASNYRMKAIKDILELSKKAEKLVYMSATTEYIDKKILNYDVKLNIKPLEIIDNIAVGQMVYLDDKNPLGCLVNQLKGYAKSGRKTVLFFDNVEELKNIKKILVNCCFKDEEIVIINSKERTDRDNKVFDDIINYSEIKEDIKLILTTSILEVGTNINNTDMNIFIYIPRATHLNFNKIIQEVARFRVKKENPGYNLLKICLPVRGNKEEFIKNINTIERELLYKAERHVEALKYSLDNLYQDENKTFIQTHIKSVLASPKTLYNTSDIYSLGVIEVDEDNEITINKFKLRRKSKEIFERQFFYNNTKLFERLEMSLKCSTWLDDVFIKSESFKEELKEIDNIKKEDKAKFQQLIKEYFSKIKEHELQELFADKVTNEIDTLIGFIEEDYNYIVEESNILKLAKQGFKMNISENDIIDGFIEYGDSIVKNREFFIICTYKKMNNKYKLGIKLDYKNIEFKEYVICRNLLDGVCSKQGRISKAKRVALLIQLIEFGNIKKYEIKKGDIYSKDKKITDNQLNKETNKLINAIYKISDNRLSCLL